MRYLTLSFVILLLVGCTKQGEVQYKYAYQYEYEAKKIPHSVLSGRVIGAQTCMTMTIRTKITFPGTTLAPIETDNDGVFTTSIPSGTYLVKAEAEGFESQTLPVVLGEGESRTLEFVLHSTTKSRQRK